MAAAVPNGEPSVRKPIKVNCAVFFEPATQSPPEGPNLEQNLGSKEGTGTDRRRASVAAEAADRPWQRAGLPDVCRGERPPAERDRRSGADRRHRQHD